MFLAVLENATTANTKPIMAALQQQPFPFKKKVTNIILLAGIQRDQMADDAEAGRLNIIDTPRTVLLALYWLLAHSTAMRHIWKHSASCQNMIGAATSDTTAPANWQM